MFINLFSIHTHRLAMYLFLPPRQILIVKGITRALKVGWETTVLIGYQFPPRPKNGTPHCVPKFIS